MDLAPLPSLSLDRGVADLAVFNHTIAALVRSVSVFIFLAVVGEYPTSCSLSIITTPSSHDELMLPNFQYICHTAF